MSFSLMLGEGEEMTWRSGRLEGRSREEKERLGSLRERSEIEVLTSSSQPQAPSLASSPRRQFLRAVGELSGAPSTLEYCNENVWLE